MLMTPYFPRYASHAMTDVPFMLFCDAAVWFYLCSLDRPVIMLAAGAFTVFAILACESSFFFPEYRALGKLHLHRQSK